MPAPDREGAFAQFLAHRAMLRAYLRALVRDEGLLDDVLSEVAVEIARSWDRYDRSMPFGPWSRGVARHVAWKRLERQQRREVALPDDVLESLGAAMDQIRASDDFEDRKRRLHHCLGMLNDRSRSLVELRYFEGLSLEEIGRRAGRSRGALYTAFSRLHAALLRCMAQSEEDAR